MLVLSRKMEKISANKRRAYNTYLINMQKRISELQENAEETIAQIPQVDGTQWNRPRLLEEWKIKKQHHLDIKDCKPAQIISDCIDVINCE
jgi:hypothetical protein